MRLLIDTHILLWAQESPRRIPRALRDAIVDDTNEILVSAATVWEIGIKRATGKLRFDRSVVDALRSLGFGLLPISGIHAEYAGSLPRHHNDPFDRMLVAQAILENLVLGTHDESMGPYAAEILGIPRPG